MDKDGSLVPPAKDGELYADLAVKEPGKMVNGYREYDLPAGIDALKASWSWLVADLKTGEKPWYDARVLFKFKDAEGKWYADSLVIYCNFYNKALVGDDIPTTWNGLTELNGKPLQVVKVSTPGMFDRFYMFDPGNGLLTLVVESKEYEKGSQIPKEESHIDWKSVHEYLPVSNHLVPSLESFMRDGRLTILSTTAHLEYIRPRMFNRE